MARRKPLSRRQLLQLVAAGTAAGATPFGLSALGGLPGARAFDGGPRFVVVIGCFGGASMLDCFMPVSTQAAHTHPDRGTVISYDTVRPRGDDLSCPDRDRPVSFIQSHGDEMVVMGYQGSSVNHFEAQRRVVNGRGIFRGRTITEAVAATYGGAMTLPNVNMGRGGYSEPGADVELNPRYQAEIVTNPVTFALSTSGHAGITPVGDRAIETPDVRARLIEKARAVRDDELEQHSPFARTFSTSRVRQDLLSARRDRDPSLESADLIEKLLYVPDLGDIFPLLKYGLTSAEEASDILDVLDDAWPTNTSGIADDRLEAQAALAYLLIRNEVSCGITLTEPGTDGFLAFDQSHTNHRSAQETHWDRVLSVADKLIELLKGAEYEDESGPTGTSYWDRTMIVFATEFGRDKWDTGGSFGTGHNMNNGLLAVSPLLQGGQVLGRTDPGNGHISGYDVETGRATPFRGLAPGEDPAYDDPNLPPGEEQVYGALLEALGVTYDGQETIPAIQRS